jgi:alanyl-tRNA synthetase
VDVAGVKVLAARVEGESKALMQTLDTLKSKLGSAAIVLGHVDGGRVSLIAGVSKDLTSRISAPDLVNAVGAQVGAKGGGRPDMARAGGGENPEALAAALASVPEWVRRHLDG